VARAGLTDIERLEGRALLTLTFQPVVNGVLTIRGTDAKEQADIWIDADQVMLKETTASGTVTTSRKLNGVRELNVDLRGGDDQLKFNVKGKSSQLKTLGVYGGRGRDELTVVVGTSATSINTINISGDDDSDAVTFIASGKVSSTIKTVNMSGGRGNDSLHAIIDAVFASDAKLNLWGEDGDDSVTVNIRQRNNIGKVAVDGGSGNDSLSVPGESAKTRFWTDVENISVPDARKLLAANSNISTAYKRLVDIPIRSGEGARSYWRYYDAIEQFSDALTSANRYKKTNVYTFCNIFADDVIGGAMNVPLPAKPNDPNMAKPANDLFDYFLSGANGWKTLSPEEIVAHVQAGRPAVAVWKNSKGPGHIGVIRPDQALSMINASTVGQIVIAQAGKMNSIRTTVANGFSGVKLSDVRFFGHA
jgi:hypothetical protein